MSWLILVYLEGNVLAYRFQNDVDINHHSPIGTQDGLLSGHVNLVLTVIALGYR